jgi:hypothetical protein
VKRTCSRPKVVVTVDGRGVVNHAGARLLADLADVTGLSEAMSEALAPLRRRDRGHDPGRVALDLAVLLADGGEAIADLAVMRNQSDLFGPVASDSTAWRVLDGIDAAVLDRIRAARARARELAWAQAAETGRLPGSTVGGYAIPGLVLDIDATIVLCHTEKESAAKTWKKTFGYHPAAVLRGLHRRSAGRHPAARKRRVEHRRRPHHSAGPGAGADPDHLRHGQDILIRSDSAGASHALLRHIRALREDGVRTYFSVGAAITEPIRAAITACLDWVPALDGDRDLRDGAEIADTTHLVDLSAYPDGTRMIVRPERPHPGAQLSVFDSIEGLRHQVFITDSPRSTCSVQLLELRHRAHARVEDRIRTGKDTGLGRFPSRQFAINAAWLELALIAIDLLALTRTLLLDGEHALAEPKKLRYRLLHVAARLVRTARRAILRIAQTWPWAGELATAYARLAALPQPVR